MHNSILIKNGHIIDPSQGIDSIGDILIEDRKIKEVRLQPNKRQGEVKVKGQIINADGLYVFPGIVDMHAHLREPGFEYKETIKTGTMAALKGGITSVCCMPNTNPVNDNRTVTEFILKKAYAEGSCYVYPIGAITKGQKGEELAEMGLMYEAGCIAFSDDGRPVVSTLLMRRALEYSKALNVPIISHCEDISLSDSGTMNEGSLSTKMGLKGITYAAEDIMVARDIILSELTGGKLHIAHVSTEGSVRLIREAKKRGINVTAETCPHYFTITEDAVANYNTNAKVNPPLRTQRDIEAIKEGLKDGTIDVIATDHAPHHGDEKLQEFDKAPSGISGFETAFSLSLKLVHDGVLSISQLIEKMSYTPARILGINAGTLKVGSQADLTIVDMNKEFKVEATKFLSKGKNTPFEGWILKGTSVMTICRGKVFDCQSFIGG
ncbi:dihydroorotase [Dissulfurispira thermophila]|uniref:Dihydroorotase n=2 Tax=root TaxID=1 RepID=A0A7G1H0E6_9BACT|nr:dihydroorotase [Dissulfurispira thermophila]BCB96184.1 dihydroorotase [Dissulfurispira thermophila]